MIKNYDHNVSDLFEACGLEQEEIDKVPQAVIDNIKSFNSVSNIVEYLEKRLGQSKEFDRIMCLLAAKEIIRTIKEKMESSPVYVMEKLMQGDPLLRELAIDHANKTINDPDSSEDLVAGAKIFLERVEV